MSLEISGVVPGILRALRDDDSDIRIRMIVSLVNMHENSGLERRIVVSALQTALADTNEEVRRIAAIALGAVTE